jgi:ABC-type sugar transport system ATPase subunit
MLYVTHDQVEAMTMATGVAVMQQGRVEQFGAPLDMYRTPETLVVASFVGSPSINRFDGRIVAQRGSPHFLGALTVPVAAPPMGVATLAVRPEHLRVDAPEGSPKAVITLVEALGPETLVHLRFEGGETGVARLSGAHRFDVGATLLVTVDPRHTLIFDAAGRLAWHGDL